MTSQDPEPRALNADRERVLSLLREHLAAGHLEIDEFERRIGQALVAPTLEDLDQLLADLPAISLPTPVPRTRR